MKPDNPQLPVIGTVLSLDDSRMDQMLTRRVLSAAGVVSDLVQFQNPEKALAFLAGPTCPEVDIILLDVNMPRMDGFEFLDAAIRTFGADFARNVVVMLTTSLDPSDQARASHFPMIRDYIAKPLEPGDVPRLIDLARSAA